MPSGSISTTGSQLTHSISSMPPQHGLLHRQAPTTVSDRDITIAVRWGATCDGLLDRDYTLERVSSHSLRAGGAMALALAGESPTIIMRVGRWTLATYLTYIHSQIGALAKGLAWKMSRQHTFHKARQRLQICFTTTVKLTNGCGTTVHNNR